MRITGIRAWQVDLPLHEGSYSWSGGKSVDVFDSTVVAVETDAGITGYGEVCPLGPSYLPAYAEGVRAGHRASSARTCSAQDPHAARPAQPRAWTRALKGHPYVKSAHRHGLLGHPRQGGRPAGLHAAGRPLRRRLRALSRDLAGVARRDGRQGRGLSRARATAGSSSRSAATRTTDIERIRAVRGDARSRATVLIADANTGWLMHEAARVVRRGARRRRLHRAALPAATRSACTIRRRTDHPFVLDEVDRRLDVLLRGHADGAMDVVNLKISKFGGLTKARQIRDLCVVARHRHDDRGQLGRRHRHRRHRPPRPQHAARVPVHRDRFQQLRHASASPRMRHGASAAVSPRAQPQVSA